MADELMPDELMDDRVASREQRHGSVTPGVAAMALGGLALAVAAVEYFVFAGIAGRSDGGINMFGLSFGTTAYVAGYTAAGVILIALGSWKIYRVRYGARHAQVNHPD